MPILCTRIHIGFQIANVLDPHRVAIFPPAPGQSHFAVPSAMHNTTMDISRYQLSVLLPRSRMFPHESKEQLLPKFGIGEKNLEPEALSQNHGSNQDYQCLHQLVLKHRRIVSPGQSEENLSPGKWSPQESSKYPPPPHPQFLQSDYYRRVSPIPPSQFTHTLCISR